MAKQSPDHEHEENEVLAFLTAQAGGAPIARRETHISVVVLAGTLAWKLKRAVKFSYLDFSTPALRLAACERELVLNRRAAPQIYRAVRRITREAGGQLVFDGEGDLVDAVVEMNRFDDATLFDVLVARHALSRQLLTTLARRIAAFHRDTSPVLDVDGPAMVAAVLDLNRDALAASGFFDPVALAAYDVALRHAFAAATPRLDARARAGKVRHCHGDLHLRNICLVDGAPVLFDCIEFDDRLATIDVLYDLAFVLMDLWHRDEQANANWLANRYLDQAEENDGLPLLPLFMSMRAAVRAHVTATQVQSASGAEQAENESAARAYLALARNLLAPSPARIVAVGGFSGTGKSTLAAALAPQLGVAPGARVVTSDRLRKALFGVDAEIRLPQEAYAAAISEMVYTQVMERAGAIARAGTSVVVEAVFDRPQDRAGIEQIAAEAGVSFSGLWLEAPEKALVARVAGRHGDASDATPDVVRAQLTRDPGPLKWARLDTGRSTDVVVREALAILQTG